MDCCRYQNAEILNLAAVFPFEDGWSSAELPRHASLRKDIVVTYSVEKWKIQAQAQTQAKAQEQAQEER